MATTINTGSARCNSWMKKIFRYIAITVLAVLIVLCFRPVAASKSDSVLLQGQVSSVSFNETNHDLNIRIAGDDRFFYINRAQEHGLDIQKVIDRIKDRRITLLYADHWTPLDPFSSTRHITEIAINDSLVFSEFR